jgi:hypothetical protein
MSKDADKVVFTKTGAVVGFVAYVIVAVIIVSLYL